MSICVNRSCLIIFTVAVIQMAAGLLAADATPGDDAAVVAQFKQFWTATETAIKAVHGDEKIKVYAVELKKLGEKIADDQLPALERFAVTQDGAESGWGVADLLVGRGQYDRAARIFVAVLAPQKEQRAYQMWKRWSYLYEERGDFLEMSRKIGLGLIHQFETGTAEDRQIVAELLGKTADEAKLSVKEFKALMHYDALQIPIVYVCAQNRVAQLQPGQCTVCKADLTAVRTGNPTAGQCPVCKKAADMQHLAVVQEAVYCCCSEDCKKEMVAQAEKYLPKPESAPALAPAAAPEAVPNATAAPQPMPAAPLDEEGVQLP